MMNDPQEVTEEILLSTPHIAKTQGQPVKLSVADENSSNKWPPIKNGCSITVCGFKCGAPHPGAQRRLEVSFA